MRGFACVMIVFSLLVSDATAGPLLRRRAQTTTTTTTTCTGPSCTVNTANASVSLPAGGTVVTSTTTTTTGDALAEVNAKRAARGLRPFVRDEGLTLAAQACASHRAANLISGHCANDFSFLPFGTNASAAGCAAYEPHYGWMSCCVYDNYTYAGAAFVYGADGKRYMHIFCR